VVERYTADGKFISSTEGPGTWRIGDKLSWFWTLDKYPGVTFSGDEWINDDGTVTNVGSIPGNDQINVAGEFCDK